MSTYGVGQGIAEGVRTGGALALQGMQIGQYNKRMDQQNAQFQKAMDADLEWKRGMMGMGPSYEDPGPYTQPGEVSPMPHITEGEQVTLHGSRLHGGRLDVPLTQFRSAVEMPPAKPVPATNPPMPPARGAAGLIPAQMPTMRRPSPGPSAILHRFSMGTRSRRVY